MNKLKSKSDVMEWYWPDFLAYCIAELDYNKRNPSTEREWKVTRPTVDNFWHWYITSGPLGVKHRNLYYTKEDIQYV